MSQKECNKNNSLLQGYERRNKIIVYIVFDRKTLQVLFDTMIINFRSGVLILWPFFRKVVISKISYFCDGNHAWLKKILRSLGTPYIWLLTNAKSVLPYRKRRKRMNTNDGIDYVTLSRWDTNKNKPMKMGRGGWLLLLSLWWKFLWCYSCAVFTIDMVHSCLYPNATNYKVNAVISIHSFSTFSIG